MIIDTTNKTMLSFTKYINHISRRPWTTSIVIVILILIGSVTLFSNKKVEIETTITATGTLSQFVEVTGQVQSSRDANLAFQTSGAVSAVYAKIGDIVPQGKVIATLQNGDQDANLLQAQAQLANAQATLGQLSQGARPEEIAIKQQAVDNAKTSVTQAYSALPDNIRNVDATTDDIIRNKLSTVFTRNAGSFTVSFVSCDQNLAISIEKRRAAIEDEIKEYQKKTSLISAISSDAAVDEAFEQAYILTVDANNLLTSISNLLLSTCSLQNSSLDAIRISLSSARSVMNTLFTDMTTKRSALLTAKNALSQATRDLDLTKAGTDPYKLKAQAATVAQAEASVASAQSGLRKTMIVAPFSGTISDANITVGETVTSGKTVISMLALDSFEIEAKVPEIDIVKVKLGQDVLVTLDAYGKGEAFPATVTRINPTATTEGSVPVYKVIVTFVGNDPRIRSGMTANVSIITESKVDALILPARFVEVRNEKAGSVIVRNGKTDTKREVVLGIRGKDGSIEIIGGIQKGDVVVAPSTDVRSAQKQTN